MGLDAKTYWLTDRQSQCDFDFDFDLLGNSVRGAMKIEPECVKLRNLHC
jgi:hypothetical protein